MELICDKELIESYNEGVRIGAVFIVFATSALSTSISIYLSRKSSKSRLLARLLLLLKLFGVGIIAGTAWIHVLPEAFNDFSNPCLSGGWEEYGVAYVGLFAMISAFLVQLIEVFGHSHVDMAHSHSLELPVGHDHHPSDHSTHTHSHDVVIENHSVKDENVAYNPKDMY